MLLFPAPSQSVMDQETKARKVFMYRREAIVTVTYEGSDLAVKPSLRTCKAAIEFGMPVAVSQEDIQRAHADKVRMERFKTFCLDEGIDPDTGERCNGYTIGVYVPDRMGYPTLVMEKDKDGNFID